MPTLPFFERLGRLLVVLFGVPDQHAWVVFQINGFAKLLNGSFRIIQQIVCIDHANLDLRRLIRVMAIGIFIGVAVRVAIHQSVRAAVGRPISPACDFGSDLMNRTEKVKEPPLLVVAHFRGHKIMEPCLLIQRRDRATIIRRHGASRVADQEGEVKLLQDRFWNDGWVLRLCAGSFWTLGVEVEAIVSSGVVIRADTALVVRMVSDGRSEGRRSPVRW